MLAIKRARYDWWASGSTTKELNVMVMGASTGVVLRFEADLLNDLDSMSLYDYFEPEPPIQCFKCGGMVEGWTGKPEGSALLAWRQGIPMPIDHKVDSEIRFSTKKMASMRLEPTLISIVGGRCKHCDARWYNNFNLLADARSSIWTDTILDPPPLVGTPIGNDWIQCPQCADAYEMGPNRRWLLCEPCGRLVEKPKAN